MLSTSRATPRRTTRRGSARAATSTSTSAPSPNLFTDADGPQARRRRPEVGRLPRVRRGDDGAGVEPDRRAAGARSAASSARRPTTARRSSARSRSPGYLWSIDAARRRAPLVRARRRRRALGHAGRRRQRRRLHGRPERLPRRLRRAHRRAAGQAADGAGRRQQPGVARRGRASAWPATPSTPRSGISALEDGFVVAFKRGDVADVQDDVGEDRRPT